MLPIIVVVAIVLMIFYIGYSREKNNRIKYIEKLISDNGKATTRKITVDELAAARQYCDYRGQSLIDDITWNDLNLNMIYNSMNYCLTSAGDEVLYFKLRNPKMSDEEWGNFETKVSKVSDDVILKKKLLCCLYDIGRSGKYCVYSYLSILDDIQLWPCTIDIILLLLYVPGIAICFFNALAGAGLIFAVMIINIATYFKKKRKIEPYFVSFQYISRLIKVSDKFSSINVDFLIDDIDELAECRRKFATFSKFASIVLGNAGNSPVGIILDYLKMLTHIDLILFKSMLNNLSDNKEYAVRMMDIVGEIDCIVSIGEYRASLDFWCVPQFDSEKLNIRDGYHPLVKSPVANSISTDRSILLTGSNASGKSTFLRMIAVNSLLAQTIHTVLAKEYHAQYYRLYTSLSLKDNILSGDSYYMAEIKSIKRILDAAKENNILGFVDEVLRGTNTVERIAASTAILKNMVKNGIKVFAATHDIELTYLIEEFENYHFEETIIDKDISFSYVLKEGRATTRNAISLLDIMGYDSDIIQCSKKMVDSYEQKGNWN